MFLYYQDIKQDSEPSFIGEFNTIIELLVYIKRECDEGHTELPNQIPTFDEYLSNDFDNYPDEYEYSFYMPTNTELDNLKDHEYISIIHDISPNEYVYFITSNKITDDLRWYSDLNLNLESDIDE
jgi:hypothetical protein